MRRLFVNQYTDPSPIRNAELLECVRRNKAIFDEVVSLDGRPSYNDFFIRINEVAKSGDISVVANSDIYFDSTAVHLDNLSADQCYALSRWEVKPDGTSEMYAKDDSGDAWCFRGAVKPMKVVADFPLGFCGCDNRASLLMEMAGYQVLNPAKTIHAMHLHCSGIRHYDRIKDRIRGPYLLITPHAIGENPKYRR